MNIGNRIKQRRLDLDMTADELSYAVGKNRATIYRYEKGDIENLPTSVLEPLADALHTTAAYLMGWTDDPIDYATLDEPLPKHWWGNPEGYHKFEDAQLQDQAKEKLNPKDKKDISKDLDSIMSKLQSGEDGPATFDGQALSSESVELFKIQLESMLTQLKVVNKEKYNPNKNKQ